MVNIIMQSLTAVVADELMSCWKFTRVSSDSTFSSIMSLATKSIKNYVKDQLHQLVSLLAREIEHTRI